MLEGDVATVDGETYTLSFGAYERTDTTSDFTVFWDGGMINFEFADDGVSGSVVMEASRSGLDGTPIVDVQLDPSGWYIVTISGLVGADGTTTVGFQAPVDGDTLGALIDDVSLTAEFNVVESTLIAGDTLSGGDDADHFIYDFTDDDIILGKDGVDAIEDFVVGLDTLTIQDLTADYEAVILEDAGGNIIAFQNVNDGSFLEDAAIQLVGIETNLDDLTDASMLTGVTIA
ncbi:MAG: hypothetical protein HKN11_05355 [Rhizobiales bacterium]|nr:hypothetical protein [Hyphomicrobiales bacterium]